MALSFSFALCASTWAQKKPTLMILPSDNWCTQRYYTTEYDNQGVKERVPNYTRAFQEDKELGIVINRIGEVMIKYGYSLKDAQQELKNISAREAEDRVTLSKTSGLQLAENPLDILKRRAKADILVLIEWQANRKAGGRNLNFTIAAFDAYTSKRIATVTDEYDASLSSISETLTNAVKKHIKAFDKQLDSFYSNMRKNGREIVLTIKTWNGAGIDLEKEYEGEELLGHIQKWLRNNTICQQFNLSDASEDMAQFEQVMIPLLSNDGKELDAREFAKGLQKHLELYPYNITSKLMMRGLGEAIIVLGEK